MSHSLHLSISLSAPSLLSLYLTNNIMNNYAILLECDPNNTLGGSCQRDIENMASHLISKCNYNSENIYLLTSSSYKTKINGINQRSSTELFSVFDTINRQNPNLIIIELSGHGFSVKDTSGDEIDGRDEAINVGNKRILDDDIYKNIILKLQCDALLFCDTCYSGTMFDLPYIFNSTNNQWSYSTNRDDKFDGDNTIISFSACSDRQLSMCDIGDYTGFGGSLTTAILNINEIMEDLVEFNNIFHCYNKIKKRIMMLNQTVILSSTKKID